MVTENQNTDVVTPCSQHHCCDCSCSVVWHATKFILDSLFRTLDSFLIVKLLLCWLQWIRLMVITSVTRFQKVITYCLCIVNQQEEMFKAREKRFSIHVPCIRVPTDAAVSYENNIVRVIRGRMRLYTFPRIRLFHVSNRAERFLAFSSSANGRMFPGFGKL